MIRGTTPDIICTLSGVTFTDITSLYVTLKQGSIILEKNLDDVVLDYPDVHVTLTQEETLKFQANKTAQIQVRGILSGNTAFASNIKTITIKEILKEGVIA